MAAFDTVFGIGVHLRSRLLASSEVTAETDRVFPVATQVDTPLPFITYFRSGMEEQQVKDGRGPRAAYFQLQIYASTWGQCAAIAKAVDTALGSFRDEAVRECILTDASENFDPTIPAFVQVLTYRVKTFK